MGLTYIKRRETGEVQRMDGVKEVIGSYLPSDTVSIMRAHHIAPDAF
jgi:hypothetical protein